MEGVEAVLREISPTLSFQIGNNGSLFFLWGMVLFPDHPEQKQHWSEALG